MGSGGRSAHCQAGLRKCIQAEENEVVDGTLTLSPPSSVTVPFRSAVEADMARRSLVSNSRRQQVMVQQELTVNDSILSVSVFLKSGVGVPQGWEAVCILGVP